VSDIEYIVLSGLYVAACLAKMDPNVCERQLMDIERPTREILDALPIDPPDGWIWGSGRRFRYLPKCSPAQRE
jgi:hypothetical protein